jgi:hypothetical protein
MNQVELKELFYCPHHVAAAENVIIFDDGSFRVAKIRRSDELDDKLHRDKFCVAHGWSPCSSSPELV